MLFRLMTPIYVSIFANALKVYIAYESSRGFVLKVGTTTF